MFLNLWKKFDRSSAPAPSEANELIKVYFRGGSGGFCPGGSREDIRKAFPGDYEEKFKALEPYLKFCYWPSDVRIQQAVSLDELLKEETRIFEEKTREAYPELNDLSVQLLVSNFAWCLWRS